MEKLKDIETIMRDYVALDERAQCLPQGSREDNWFHEFIQNTFKALAATLFPNQATFETVLDEMRALARYREQGFQLTLSEFWVKFSNVYLMVNGASGEDISNVMLVLSTPGTARVMLAQARPALSDHIGREKAASRGKA